MSTSFTLVRMYTLVVSEVRKGPSKGFSELISTLLIKLWPHGIRGLVIRILKATRINTLLRINPAVAFLLSLYSGIIPLVMN